MDRCTAGSCICEFAVDECCPAEQRLRYRLQVRCNAMAEQGERGIAVPAGNVARTITGYEPGTALTDEATVMVVLPDPGASR